MVPAHNEASIQPSDTEGQQLVQGTIFDPVLSTPDGIALTALPFSVNQLASDATASTRIVGKGTRTARSSAKSPGWLQGRAQDALARSNEEMNSRVLQQVLPLWDDMRRAVPNPFLRSGLFGMAATSKRRFMNGEQVASLANFDIRYKGEELLQEDLTVWMSLINLARRQRVADAVFFTGYELIQDMGWRLHSESYERAKLCIERLKANSLKVLSKTGDEAYAGSLIREFAYAKASGGRRSKLDDQADHKWMVRFEPRIANLFMQSDATLLWWEQRKEIGTRAAFTLWLHGFYSSHTEPIPYTIEQLIALSRSETSRRRDFVARLDAGLKKLVEIGCLEQYKIVNDRVHVKKAPFAAQASRFTYTTARSVITFRGPAAETE